jgi:hypothetical protein
MAPTDEPGVWRREFRLPPGRYAYRLIIDGRWCSDPANPYVESNPYGELNNVVEVSGCGAGPGPTVCYSMRSKSGRMHHGG